jgi:UDP-GlcNAc:undecaprenyl-phosphate/decaprenyl-phosphate GlcNAc-1-phosphate transferase
MGSVGALLLAFALSVAATPLVIKLATRHGLVSRPKADRWNLRSTPLMGGVAIYLGVTGSVLSFSELGQEMVGVLCGGTLIFILGVIDDVLQIKPSSKFLGQILAACVVLYAGLKFDLIPNPFLNIFLTVLWVVGITNAFNLLDNMDGLSAGVAAISALTTFVFSLIQGLPEISILSLAVLGATLGFLLFNFKPARIFMGDCGSLFLGFTLACTTILGSWEQASNLFGILAIPALALGVPIFDTLLVTVSRVISGRSVSLGGRDHTSHRLVALGMSERKAVVSLYLLCGALGAIAIFSVLFNLVVSGLITTLSIIMLALFGLYLGQKRVYRYDPDEAGGSKDTSRGGFYSSFIRHKMRILEVAIDTCLISLAFVTSYVLRFDGVIPPQYERQIAATLPPLIAIQLSLFYYFGLYRIIWVYMDVYDLVTIAKAVFSGTIVTVLAIVGLTHFDGYSRVVFVLNTFLLLVLVTGSRMLFRLFREYFAGLPRRGHRLLIVGAGDAGEMILREIRNNPGLEYQPVGFIDDDASKTGKRIHGLPVFGGSEALPGIARSEKVDEILIAIPSLSEKERYRIVALCEETGKRYRVMQNLAKSVLG